MILDFILALFNALLKNLNLGQDFQQIIYAIFNKMRSETLAIILLDMLRDQSLLEEKNNVIIGWILKCLVNLS